MNTPTLSSALVGYQVRGEDALASALQDAAGTADGWDRMTARSRSGT